MNSYEYKDDTDREMLTGATSLTEAIAKTESSLREQVTAGMMAPGCTSVSAEVIEWVDGEEGEHHDVSIEI